LGNAQHFLGQAKTGEQTLLDGLRAAEASRQDELAARALVGLAVVVGFDQHRYDEGKQWGTLAGAAIARAGGDLDIAAKLKNFEGMLAFEQEQYDAAAARFQESLALTERALSAGHPDVAMLLGNISSVELRRGQHALAAKAAERALFINQSMLGDG